MVRHEREGQQAAAANLLWRRLSCVIGESDSSGVAEAMVSPGSADVEDMLGTLHVALAVASLAVGAGVLFQRKGTKRHRQLGYFYSVALLLVNLSALSVYQDTGRPGTFHILALISLATLSAGFVPAFLRKPRDAWMRLHAYFMSWSYVGLVAAGVAQLATKLSHLPGWLAVGLPSIVIVAGGGFLIHTRVPEALADLAAHRARPKKRLQPDRTDATVLAERHRRPCERCVEE